MRVLFFGGAAVAGLGLVLMSSSSSATRANANAATPAPCTTSYPSQSFVGISGAGNVAGGDFSTIPGGADGKACSEYGAVLGGFANNAAGSYAVVAGGDANEALGVLSFAAGYHAHAIHNGSFVWSDYVSGAVPLADSANNQFVVRATGGSYFTSSIGLSSIGDQNGVFGETDTTAANSTYAGVHGVSTGTGEGVYAAAAGPGDALDAVSLATNGGIASLGVAGG